MKERMSMTEESKEVAAAPSQVPMVVDYGADAGAVVEDVTREEVRIPILRVLQSNSPQCKPIAAGGLSGAAAGMIFNTATQEAWRGGDDGVLLIPVHRDHNYIEYVPRDAGGGFVAIHEPGYELIPLLHAVHGRFGRQPTLTPAAWEEKFKKLALARRLPKGVAPNAIPVGGSRSLSWEDAAALYREINPPGGTELVETFYLYSIVGTPDGIRQRDVVTFSSTQIGKYQNFMSRYVDITYPNSQGDRVHPPLWAHRLRLGTMYQKNKKGEFYGWLLRFEEEPPLKSRMRLDDSDYRAARAFYDMLKSGAAKIDRAADAAAGGSASEEEEMPF
jgi:hypothetical protein